MDHNLMAKFYQTKEARAQIEEWNKRLADAGFIDVETKPRGFIQSVYEGAIIKLQYFRTITNMAHEDADKIDPKDLTIMTMLGDGFKIKQIAQECNLHRQTVRFIIRRYEHHWGIRFWTLAQRYLTREPK